MKIEVEIIYLPPRNSKKMLVILTKIKSVAGKIDNFWVISGKNIKRGFKSNIYFENFSKNNTKLKILEFNEITIILDLLKVGSAASAKIFRNILL